jgi:hypothetical protein
MMNYENQKEYQFSRRAAILSSNPEREKLYQLIVF